jgi:4-hydroxy-tetrahydrodipicolinate synthase
VYLLAMAGKADEARALNATISILHDHLFLESNPIPVKWALHKMGKCGTGIRLPLTVLSNDCQAILAADLQKLNLL